MRIKGLLLVLISLFMFSNCYAYEYSYNDNNYNYNESTIFESNNDNNDFNIISGIVFILIFVLSFITPFIVFIAIVFYIFKRSRSKSYFDNMNYNYSNIKYNGYDEVNVKKDIKYNDIDISILKSYLPNYELYTLKQKLLNTFNDINSASTLFDYKTLRRDCGDALYNSYVSQLELFKSNGTKNVIKDLVAKDIRIFDIKKVYDSIYVSVYLDVSYYDYMIRVSNGAVINGNAGFKIDNKYLLLFEYKKISNNKWNCPNCGAVMGSTDICDYCGTNINDNRCEFVLNRKSLIRK